MIRFRPLPGMTLWAVPALLILIGLGVWQVQRLHEKEQLLTTIAERMGGPETPVDDVLRLPVPDMEWRRVRAQGHFVHDKEAYVYATEFDFRWNNRISLGVNDVQRTNTALRAIAGKRLTYRA